MVGETVIRVGIFFENSHWDTRPHYEYALEWLQRKGFDVVETPFLDTFEVRFDTSDNADKEMRRLDVLLIAISLRNRMGFFILRKKDVDDDRYHQWVSIPPGDENLDTFTHKCTEDEKFRVFVDNVRLYYAQVDPRSKIILGFSLLEDRFGANPEHILTTTEQERLCAEVDSCIADLDKREKVKNALKDANRMARFTRNERMAKTIASYMGDGEAEVLKRITEISALRGKLAHSAIRDIDQPKVEETTRYIECIFEMFLIRKFGFSKIHLHF